MRKFIIGAMILFIMGVGGPGVVAGDRDITFTWDQNTEPDLAGYKLYGSLISGDYSGDCPGVDCKLIIDLPATLVQNLGTVTVNADDNKYFVMTAYDNETPSLESDFSNECSTFTNKPPGFPGGFGCE